MASSSFDLASPNSKPVLDTASVSDDEQEVLHTAEQRLKLHADITNLLDNRQLQEALDKANVLVEMYPDKPKLHADLGGILYQMGNYTSAELHASIAAELDPSSYMIRHFRAMCCEQRQDFHCARIDYQAMLNMSKRMPQKVAALKQMKRVAEQARAISKQYQEDRASGKENRKAAGLADPLLKLEAIAKTSIQIRSEASLRALEAKAKACLNNSQNTMIQFRNKGRVERRARQVTAAEVMLETMMASDTHTRLAGTQGAARQARQSSEVTAASTGNAAVHGKLIIAGAAANMFMTDDEFQPLLHSPQRSTSTPHTHTAESQLDAQLTPTRYSNLVGTPEKQDNATTEDWTDDMFFSSPESLHERPISVSEELHLPLPWEDVSASGRARDQKANAYQLKKAGDAAYRAKNFPQALSMYSRSLESDPGNAVLLNNRASVHLKLGDWLSAISDSLAALAIRPRHPGLDVCKAHARVAKAMMNDGDISGAQATVCEGLLEGSKDRELKALQPCNQHVHLLVVANTDTANWQMQAKLAKHQSLKPAQVHKHTNSAAKGSSASTVSANPAALSHAAKSVPPKRAAAAAGNVTASTSAIAAAAKLASSVLAKGASWMSSPAKTASANSSPAKPGPTRRLMPDTESGSIDGRHEQGHNDAAQRSQRSSGSAEVLPGSSKEMLPAKGDSLPLLPLLLQQSHFEQTDSDK